MKIWMAAVLGALAGCAAEGGPTPSGAGSPTVASSAQALHVHCPPGEAPVCDPSGRCHCEPVDPPPPEPDPCLTGPATLTVSAAGPVDVILGDLSWSTTSCGKIVLDIVDTAYPYAGVRPYWTDEPAYSLFADATSCADGQFPEAVYMLAADGSLVQTGGGGSSGSACYFTIDSGVRTVHPGGWSLPYPSLAIGNGINDYVRVVMAPFWKGSPLPIHVHL